MNNYVKLFSSEIGWHGDMNDDCFAKWNGLFLRAEWLDGEGTNAIWWWSVGSIKTGEELDTSNRHSHTPNSGEDARKCAEVAAQPWLLKKGFSKNSRLESHNNRYLRMSPK